jgi:hypothetical protein
MNGPRALVDMVRGRPLEVLEPRPQVLMMRYWQEVFAERNIEADSNRRPTEPLLCEALQGQS